MMTSKERDLQNYNKCIERAAKLQSTLDTGVLNEESIQVLKSQISNELDNANRYKRNIDSIEG